MYVYTELWDLGRRDKAPPNQTIPLLSERETYDTLLDVVR